MQLAPQLYSGIPSLCMVRAGTAIFNTNAYLETLYSSLAVSSLGLSVSFNKEMRFFTLARCEKL